MNRKIINTLLLAMFLSACGSKATGSRQFNLEEKEAFGVSTIKWEERLPPVKEKCSEEYNNFEVVSYPTKEATSSACGIPESWQNLGTYAAGCYLHAEHGFMNSKTTPTIVYWSNQPLFPIIFHEFSHFGSWCAYGNSDVYHSRKEVWDYVNAVNKEYMKTHHPTKPVAFYYDKRFPRVSLLNPVYEK